MNSFREPSTLVELLRWRASHQSDQVLYTFLADGESEEIHLTYGELDRKARILASKFQSIAQPGDRALLLYQPGLEFIAAFFGCLYAGIIAVPAYPPRNSRNVPRIQVIAADAEAKLCLASANVMGRSKELFGVVPGLERMLWLATDEGAEERPDLWKPTDLNAQTLAYLQYTSGSTSAPKGVMISHGNLLHNLSFLCDGRGHTKIVSWLPFFHDMGLIYGILQGLYGGFPCILMAPASFLQRPFRWLQALSKYTASTAIAPNFAYELCVQKISEDEKKLLDLSRWTMALNAAEPVRIETLERFAAAFASCGFRPDFLKPAYGLAEATLGVSIFAKEKLYCAKTVDKAAFEQHRIAEVSPGTGDVRYLIGCGQGASDQKIAIVEPETRRRCGPREVGEIWLSSPSVAQGYWKKPKETKETFHAFTSDTDEGPFLRTGDLGYFEADELFITGRLKDLIIIRGGNHYPQDIELSVQKAHTALQPEAGAAFSIEVTGEERLVIVQELVRHHKADLDKVVQAIREAVAETHGIQLYGIQLVRPHCVPKTSSGKIQRHAARTKFLEGSFEVEHEWRAELDPPVKGPEAEHRHRDSQGQPEQTQSLEAWLIARLSQMLHIIPSEINVRQPFSRYGLDSLGAVSLAGELQTKLGRPVPASLLFDYPSIEALFRHLSPRAGSGAAPSSNAKGASPEPIAIIGLGCRLPGAKNPRQFWELLRQGVDAITEVPRDRWDIDALYDSNPGSSGKISTRWGGFLHEVDQFDPDFFEISPREAIQMDPQQRLLMEVTWEALEDAGIPPTQLAGSKTGVFVGLSSFDYSLLQLREPREIDAYVGTGLAHSVAANRISYFLDLRGPSLAVDTACSSSLVAIHQACESLRQGECDLALTGGVNLLLSPELTIALSQARMMAADGRCKTFDSRADGYVRAEGCGVIVLKRLSDALQDGDTISALIQGSAVNQDGRSNGLTAPNGPAQEAVIRKALERARVSPHEISFVECHGTGTSLGDPQEVEALNHVLSPGRPQSQTCWIGSVKTNIGHLEAAAGIAGVLKVVLSLQHKTIPAHLHVTKVNPLIPLDKTPFAIPMRSEEWTTPGRRLAGVSSFGFGGTNAHLILAEAPELEHPKCEVERPVHLLALSAKSAVALQSCARALAEHLASSHGESLENICFTSTAGRSHFSQRAVILAASLAEARDRLARFSPNRKVEDVCQGQVEHQERPHIAFLFTGQGSQYPGMGRILYQTQPTFRRALDQCAEILRPCLDLPLLSVLYPKEGEASPLQETLYAQPALFSVEYALAELWRSWGIVPGAVLGHSVGEYVAACVAGVFDLESGLQLIATRARLMSSLARNGQMVVVFANVDLVRRVLSDFPGAASVAAVNGPAITVLSGEQGIIERILAALQTDGIGHERLPVSHAFHSPLMEPILKDFERAAQKIRYQTPRIRFISNLTGDWMPADAAPDAKYWTEHLRQPVLFSQGMSRLRETNYTCFLECGPQPVLLAMGKRCLTTREGKARDLVWLPSLKKEVNDWRTLLESVARLHVSGASIDWEGFHRDYSCKTVSLPSYPFQRARYWVAARESLAVASPRPEDKTWQVLLRAGSEQAKDCAALSLLEKDRERLASLNQLSVGYIWRAIGQLGFFAPGSNRGSITELASRRPISARNTRILESWLNTLVKAGHLEMEDQTFQIGPSSSIPPVEPIWEQTVLQWEGQLYWPNLVKECGERLADVITGSVDPLTLLFPNGSWTVLERIYKDSTVAQFYNNLLAKLLKALLSVAAPDRPLRILEVGGGTGGSTASMLPMITPGQASYTFTDLGASFVQQAQTKFQGFPFVICRVLDLERSPEEQGFTEGSFDVVIAANVLHATRNLQETLGRVRELLAPAGHLLIWEATELWPWLDITFGLLEGWHLFNDKHLRATHPLLAVRQWNEVLRAAGFGKVQAFPEEQKAGLGQHILMAQTNLRPAERPSSITSQDLKHSAQPPRQQWLDELFYEMQWELQPEKPAQRESETNFLGTWLLFADRAGLARKIGALIKQRGGSPIFVWPAKSFACLHPNTFGICPGESGHLTTLIQEIGRDSSLLPFRGIIHLWSLDAGRPERTSLASLKKAQRLGCESVIPLIQVLAGQPSVTGRGKSLWLVTRGVQEAPGDERRQAAIAQAPFWGLANVVALEHPNLWGGIIDLDPSPHHDEALMVLEALQNPGQESRWAFRQGRKYVPRLVRSSLPSEGKAVSFSADATYLITGGLGGMGLKAARWMVEQGARRLLLLGRSKIPPRTQWRKLASDGGLLAEKVSAVLELEKRGASVHLAEVDVSDRRRLAAFLKGFKAQAWPPIRGVIHAAGVLEDHALVSLSPESMEKVLRPKMAGGWLLHQLLQDTPLDFFVLFSSAASIFGSAGQANHAAANAFLDGLARFRRARSLPAQSINWGPWAEVGAAARNSGRAKMMAKGIAYLSPETGIAALERAMTLTAAQMTVISIDWRVFLEERGEAIPLLTAFHPAKLVPEKPASPGSGEAAPTAAAVANTLEAVETKLREHAGTLLMLAPSRVDPSKPLGRLGFDSLMAVQLKNEMEANWGASVPLHEISQTSLAELARRIMGASTGATAPENG